MALSGPSRLSCHGRRRTAPPLQRTCYATWLVSGGVPVNVVQAVMGHEQASTTLDRYTHTRRTSMGRCARSSAAPLTIC
ncbi:tyrosine-type recombinase/integrase [Micromonospora sp. RTP1Z1]|uniref:tyrosine-type recombinase/integrase n=1 Tax=Micromonospora sp. RTP1Z1 TaxID=2994043 RepID=UPI0029C6BE32|nr:tyrosine-type recombinase/integrase [Micromonospora sp. RTP1Z1]